VVYGGPKEVEWIVSVGGKVSAGLF